MATVHVRYYASARAAAGTEQETLTVGDGSTVADVIERIRGSHDSGIGKILDVAGFLVDGVALRDRESAVEDGITLDVLPPFAGG